ncbi:hypothetical protein [Brevundimonas sp. M20]|uniref:hypothetical protein n=1 Tax=Brevundimonas sp. M20 TaxID=2591463 RepID=UPI0011463469|nr:hypothetical protein [Brevundimonas sp. M20]QDH72656.1 hypothetical protein FKQ52_03940 [Brevundimonas sp. M20]
MRRAPCLTLGLATLALTATGLADAAQAQTAPPQYLRWAGRPEVVALPTTDRDGQPAAAQRRPNRVIPHGGYAATVEAPAPVAAPRTLTPANAWLRTPPPAATPVPPPPPPARATVAPAPAAAQPSRAMPEYLPEQGGRGQPAPADVAMAAAQPAPVAVQNADEAVDPMAPRRDAPIFRIQQPSAPAAAPIESASRAAPTEQGARYYSVHRQNGRTPDAVSIPEPSYVDGLAVTTPVSLASQDLAEPQSGPTLIRDAQGRTRIQPAAPEGDYQ